ncbi:hypothetical protein IK7_03527 [Bacillus cereus VD156]|uniref:Uncharacterized protein n=1 Tax=Bacillus cereus (strain VD014) TaxID=1053223 RepID=A0A9W5NR14_BACC8|nr:hypothetical protein IIA_01878 [Bacillus cereus VD014]EJR79968.1 hypothetical protein IK7_03527 [Bacillus cereus VD156]
MMDGNPIDMRGKQSMIYWGAFTIVPCLIIKWLNSKKGNSLRVISYENL